MLEIDNIAINLMTEDISESLDFYVNELGFKLIFIVDDKQTTYVTEDLDKYFDNRFRLKSLDKKDIENKKEDKKIIFAQIWDENNKIMLQDRDDLIKEIPELNNKSIWWSFSFYIKIENIDIFYNKIKSNKKVKIIKEINTSWYWMKELIIMDNSGYVIMFSEIKK